MSYEWHLSAMAVSNTFIHMQMPSFIAGFSKCRAAIVANGMPFLPDSGSWKMIWSRPFALQTFL